MHPRKTLWSLLAASIAACALVVAAPAASADEPSAVPATTIKVMRWNACGDNSALRVLDEPVVDRVEPATGVTVDGRWEQVEVPAEHDPET